MRVVHSLPDAQIDRDSVVTIGSFDGIHRGHRAVIDSVRQAARDHQRTSVVVTFFPHPGVVLRRAEPFYLTSTDEKIAILGALEIDLLVVMRFTLEMARTRAADYVSMLIEHLRMREAHVGYDFAFGHNREGTVDFLRRSGAQRGFDVHEIPPETNGGEAISSTGIRQALRQGDVERAAKWLGRPFRLSGSATESDDPDPAAQLDVWQEHAFPADGMYACWAWLDDRRLKSVVRVGAHPIEGGKAIRTVSANLIDWRQRIGGAHIALDFIARLHGEEHATHLDQLKTYADKARELLVG